MTKLKVAFDIRPLTNPEKYRGVGVYTKNLLQGLKKEDLGIKLIEFSDESQIPGEVDLIHYPYFNPFLVTLPLYSKIPRVITVHDVIPLLFPQHFPKGFRGWFKWQRQKLALKLSQQIITDSLSSKKDIIKVTGIRKTKVNPVYLAADPIFQPASQSEQKRVRQKYDLPAKFVLYVGDFNWNKNVVNLTKACLDLDLALLVLGSKAIATDYDHFHPENRALTQFQELATNYADLTTPGFVAQKDLVALYSTATVYCQPSYYEGFGLPVLEAMVCGCPVVCSQNSSLVEVAGSAAIAIKDPKHLNSIETALSQAFNLSPSARDKLIKKGLIQAQQFSWQKTVKETIKVYENTKK